MYEVLIVPGSSRKEENKLRAIAAGYALTNKLSKNLLLCGGVTNEKSEALIMLEVINKKFKLTNKKRIYLEEMSFDTSSNLENALKIIKQNKWKRIGILSSSYHLKRLMKIARCLNIESDLLSIEDVLINNKLSYEKMIKKYYKTNEMKNAFTAEFILDKMLIFDPKGTFPKRLSASYYKFIR